MQDVGGEQGVVLVAVRGGAGRLYLSRRLDQVGCSEQLRLFKT